MGLWAHGWAVWRRRGLSPALVVLSVLIALLAGLGPANASGLPGGGSNDFDPASDSENNHCFAPGGDANVIVDMSEQFVGAPGCAVVDTGEFYVPLIYWATNFSFEVVPDGFSPQGDTPMDDLFAKLVSLRYVVDAGTARERTLVFRPQDIARLDTFDEFLPWLPPFPVVHFLAKLPPLPPGNHSVQTFWTVSALHCDGFDIAHRLNCFPPGETLYSTIRFTVVEGASQSK
jgi:hypothetical protein